VSQNKTSTYPVELRQKVDRLVATVNSQKPAKKDLDELKEALRAMPEIAEDLGGLGQQLRYKITEGLSAQPGWAVVIRTRVTQMMRELGYETAPLLEKLLIDQVMCCWLRLHDTEFRYQVAKDNKPTWAQMEHWERRLTAAQRRYLRAVETLANVRRLAVRTPAVLQVNVGQQQIIATPDGR